jgi:site-specific recombinase XerC
MGDDLKSIRDRAILLIGFAGAFRRSELSQLDINDVEWLPNGIIITLNRSKTDQEGTGRRIAIPLGRTQRCPVTTLRNWGDRTGITDGALFRPINGQIIIFGSAPLGRSRFDGHLACTCSELENTGSNWSSN